MTDRERSMLAAVPFVASAIVLGYVLTLAGYSRSGFPESLHHGQPMPYLSDKPLGEDAYYMMTIGWNLAAGQGLSYGGQPTTGTQPLMTLLYGGLAAIVRAAGGDKWTFARAVLAFDGMLFVGFAAITMALARALLPSADRLAIGALAAVLTLFNYTLFRVFTYGLETGLYLIVAGLCILASLRAIGPGRTVSRVMAVGAWAGVAACARIDFLVVFAAFLAVAWIRRLIAFRDAALAGLLAVAFVAPWLMWVRSVTGNWMPSSGQSQMGVITAANAGARLEALLWSLATHASPWLYPELLRTAAARLVPGPSHLWKIAIASALLGLGLVVATRVNRSEGARRVVTPALSLWFWAVAILAAIYVVLFWPTYFYSRYTALLVLFTIPVLTAGLYELTGHRVPALAVLTGGAALFLSTAFLTLHRGEAGNTYSVTARVIETRIPPTEHIGAFSSGVFGYFFDNVVNFDGKVNAAAMRARREGRLGRYINGSGVSILLDWRDTIQSFVPDAYFDACWEPCALQLSPEQGSCFKRRACASAAW
jgi:hypothetical protein